MKRYDLGDVYLSHATLDIIEDEIADMVKYKKLMEDFMSDLAALRYHSGVPFGYKDMLLAKEMFKMGYLAAHVVGEKYEYSEKSGS